MNTKRVRQEIKKALAEIPKQLNNTNKSLFSQLKVAIQYGKRVWVLDFPEAGWHQGIVLYEDQWINGPEGIVIEFDIDHKEFVPSSLIYTIDEYYKLSILGELPKSKGKACINRSTGEITYIDPSYTGHVTVTS